MSGIKSFTEEEINTFSNKTIEAGVVNNTIAKTIIADNVNDYYYLIKLPWNNGYNSQIWISASGLQRAFIRYAKDKDTWDTPRLICTTKVYDVPKTTLSLNNNTAFTDGVITYNVTNGICDLTLAGITNDLCSSYNLSDISFPRPKNNLVTVPLVDDTNGNVVGMFYLDSNYNSLPTCHIYKTNARAFGSISYLVAES